MLSQGDSVDNVFFCARLFRVNTGVWPPTHDMMHDTRK